MASFPAIFSGSVALYPLQRSTRLATKVLEFTNFTEQRWRTGNRLESFTLSFSEIVLADMLTLRTFFDARKGGFDTTWDITIGGTTYPSMMFIDDTFEATEGAGSYSVQLRVRQVH